MSEPWIVIPAYEPDRRLLTLLSGLQEQKVGPVVLVDDGSGPEYADLFQEASKILKKEGGG